MYACIFENGCGFFQRVCAPSNAPAIFRDPPPTPQIREPEYHYRGSGPKRNTRRATVDGALA